MGFAENLKEIRKQRNITQEELAEMLNVSRQAVSKWEAGNGYPETEKLLIIAKELNVSLDYLFSDEPNTSEEKTIVYAPSGKIAITTFDNKNVVVCHAVKSNKILTSAKGQPKYILDGIDNVSFWGENRTILGWYETIDDIQKEIAEITEAINKGEGTYKLKYNADIEFVGFFEQPKIKGYKDTPNDKPVVCTPSGQIAIATFDNTNVAMCKSVHSQRVFFAKKGEPKYLLIGISLTSAILLESPPELGWYESLEDIQKEIAEINEAIIKGEPSYKLKYNVDVELVGIFKRPKIKK